MSAPLSVGTRSRPDRPITRHPTTPVRRTGSRGTGSHHQEPERQLVREARRCEPVSERKGAWTLPNAPVKVAADPLYRRTGSATSYGLITAAAASRLIAVPGQEVGAAGPLLSLVFIGLVALDANYTRQGGINQNRAAADAHAKLASAQASLAALAQLPEELRQLKQQELSEDMAVWLQDNPALQRQVLTACDTLVDIDTHARAAAASTAKVLVRQSDLASWRAEMGQQLVRLRGRLERRQAQPGSPAAHWPPTTLRRRRTERLQHKVGQLEERIRLYDTLGKEALETVYVNLSATQAKQVRDVYLYGVAASTGGPAQVISAVNLFGQMGGTVAVPAEAMLSAAGLGVVASGVSIFTNYLDGWKDAPRELKRASNAKRLTQLQMSALADAQSRSSLTRQSADEAAALEHGATDRALAALMRNRVGRYQELHRLTNQAWIRRIPEAQIMRIRALARTGQSMEQITTLARKALLASVGLDLKIHDTRHPDTATNSPGPQRPWEAIDDTPSQPLAAARTTGARAPDQDTPTGEPPQDIQPADLKQWLEPLSRTTKPVGRSATRNSIETQAWSLVWTTVKEDSRPGLRRPGGRWRRSSEVLAQWDQEPTRRLERQQRIRQRLKERIEQTVREQSLPTIKVTDSFLDRVLSAASRQADAFDQALPVDIVLEAAPLTPALRQHYRDVGQLARQLTMTP